MPRPARALCWWLLCSLLCLPVTGFSAEADPADFDTLYDSWTLEEQVGQLLIWGSTNAPEDLTPILEGEGAEIPPIPVGGILITSKASRTNESVRVLADFLRTTNKTPVPPFLCADQEGGKVAALRDGVRVAESHAVLGQLGIDEIYDAAYFMGVDTHNAGVDMILGPVFDVDGEPLNPVIGGKERSFSGDPAVVGEAATTFMRALEDAGLVAVAKHFPGHGTAEADSHLTLPHTAMDYDAWMASEQQPYASLVTMKRFSLGDRPHGVMVAHLDWPALCNDEGPTCFSRHLVTETLRAHYLEDRDVIISDDLMMRAIEDPVLGAVNMRRAGIDLLIIGRERATLRSVHKTLVKFYRNGWLDRKELKSSVRRIYNMKQFIRAQWAPLEVPQPDNVDGVVESPADELPILTL